MTYHLLRAKRTLDESQYLLGYQQPACYAIIGYCFDGRWEFDTPSNQSYDFTLKFYEEMDKASSIEELMQKHFELFL